MTAQRFVRKNAGGGHSYLIDGRKAPGVTTVKKILAAPGLTTWAARMASEVVVNEWDHLTRLSPSERQEYVRTAPDRARNTAANRGKRIHAMAERLQNGQAVDVPPELLPQIEAIAKALDKWGMRTVAAESPCANLTYRYAGTFDAVCWSPKLGNVLVDYKTRDDGRAPYDDVALQLAAYRYTELRLVEVQQVGPQGGKKPSRWDEAPMVPVDSCGVFAVSGDSAVFYPVVADEAVFEVFLRLLDVHYDWELRTGWKHKDEPEFDPTVGEPLWPEQVPDQEATA